jgi:hypothetical protein
MQATPESPRDPDAFHLAAALRKTLLLGAALFAGFAAAPAFAAPAPAKEVKASPVVAKATGKKSAKPKPAAVTAKARTKAPRKSAKAPPPGPLADFGQHSAPTEVVHLANWVSYTRNNQKKAFVLIDKKQAQLYVFDPRGKLRSVTPVLLGQAVGDHSAPGVGNKPLSQIKPEEKTTPAGRFLARPGKNIGGDDIIWIDYNAAVSMHRLRKVSAKERRAERMATADASDNRISNGCVNVPPKFYDGVLRPTVLKQGAYVYVLPETVTPQKLFGSYDVPSSKDKPVQLAEAPAAAAPKPAAPVKRRAS